MTIYDLLFLAAFLASMIALIAAAYAAVRGNVPRAFSILVVWLGCGGRLPGSLGGCRVCGTPAGHRRW